MNLNGYKESFLFKLPSSSSHSFIPNTAETGNVYIFIIANIQSFTCQILGVVWSLGRKRRFFSPLGFVVQTNSDQKTLKIKFLSVRALKRYLNEENLIHGRVMAMISKFSPQIVHSPWQQGNVILKLSVLKDNLCMYD